MGSVLDNNIKMNLKKLSKEELINKVIEIQKEKQIEEDFLLNISHDLRSPLNVILSAIQCYCSKDKNDCISIIKRNCFKMLKLINNLIDTTKLNKKYYNLSLENIDIINLIEGNVELIDKYAKIKGISLVFDTNIEECEMAIDAYAMDRIITNLLSNAIKFSPRGENIYINTLKNNDILTISIKDHGIGIPKDEQKSIFNRFVQSSKNKISELGGSGIGLELVKCLTEAHGGTINLISEENKGSEFIIKMPIKKVENKLMKENEIANSKVDVLEIEFSDIYL